MDNRLRVATRLKQMLAPTESKVHKRVRRNFAIMVRINLESEYIKRGSFFNLVLAEPGDFPWNDWLYELATEVIKRNRK